MEINIPDTVVPPTVDYSKSQALAFLPKTHVGQEVMFNVSPVATAVFLTAVFDDIERLGVPVADLGVEDFGQHAPWHVAMRMSDYCLSMSFHGRLSVEVNLGLSGVIVGRCGDWTFLDRRQLRKGVPLAMREHSVHCSVTRLMEVLRNISPDNNEQTITKVAVGALEPEDVSISESLRERGIVIHKGRKVGLSTAKAALSIHRFFTSFLGRKG